MDKRQKGERIIASFLAVRVVGMRDLTEVDTKSSLTQAFEA